VNAVANSVGSTGSTPYSFTGSATPAPLSSTGTGFHQFTGASSTGTLGEISINIPEDATCSPLGTNNNCVGTQTYGIVATLSGTATYTCDATNDPTCADAVGQTFSVGICYALNPSSCSLNSQAGAFATMTNVVASSGNIYSFDVTLMSTPIASQFQPTQYNLFIYWKQSTVPQLQGTPGNVGSWTINSWSSSSMIALQLTD